jgi:hypothetical protein
MEKKLYEKTFSGEPMISTFKLVKHNEGVPGEWWDILRVAQNGESLQNQWGGYSTRNTGAPKYIKKIWESILNRGDENE